MIEASVVMRTTTRKVAHPFAVPSAKKRKGKRLRNSKKKKKKKKKIRITKTN